MRMPFKVTLLLFFAIYSTRTVMTSLLTDEVCYEQLGCFSTKGAFSGGGRILSATPASPDHIRTQYLLHTRRNAENAQALDARKPEEAQAKWTQFRQRTETKIIVHGFIDDNDVMPWMKKMKDAFLKHGDYNVIIVDWHHGNLPPYTQATANTRVVGAQIAVLIHKLQLQNIMNVSASNIHIIGHSLGSHIAGYAGERVPGLRRITGLDPAGPYFEGTDKVVRLDPTDADLVDNIHTDGKDILEFGFGTMQPMGHMDFYPNEGRDQPGCTHDLVTNLLHLGLAIGAEETVACNHLRSIKFFTESINSECPFKSFPCPSVEDFKKAKCNSCQEGKCASMGLRADDSSPATGKYTKYFSTTADASPFCQYHLDVKLEMSFASQASGERGTLKIRFNGQRGSSDWIPFQQEYMTFNPGSTYERAFSLHFDLAKLISVELQWHHSASVTNPLKWNILGLRNPKLYFSRIVLVQQEQEEITKFCIDDIAADNNIPFLVNTRC